MELQKIIGANVKAIRERKKLTLDAAAQLSGVSRSMLAKSRRAMSILRFQSCGRLQTASRYRLQASWTDTRQRRC